MAVVGVGDTDGEFEGADVGVDVGHAPLETTTSESPPFEQSLAKSRSHSLLYVLPSDPQTRSCTAGQAYPQSGVESGVGVGVVVNVQAPELTRVSEGFVHWAKPSEHSLS